MDSSYQNVMDMTDSVWMFVGYGVHLAMSVTQAGVAAYLIVTGALRLRSADLGGSGAKPLAAARIGVGLLLIAPVATGAPPAVSFLACLAAAALLLYAGRARATLERGRWLRRGAIASAAIAGLFMLWEREDNLALGVHLLWNTAEWRNEEVTWQHETDPKAPKLGDLAPDFALQDPSGTTQVRLSDFRGKRPVALVFGSYT